MEQTTGPDPMAVLAPLVGTWRMAASFAADASGAPAAFTTFEWMSGRRFLIQRWEVDHPDAPDGMAVIGFDPVSGLYRQHYFDERGVARLYDMTFADGVWTLERHAEKPDFSQRFTGRLDDEGASIAGRWEIARSGADWAPDFDLTYTRIKPFSTG
jgi:hypothetical protein